MKDLTFEFSLQDKVILLTGCLGVLGQNFCKTLASKKANLAVSDFEPKKTIKMAEELSSTYGIDCLPVPGDLRKLDDIVNIVSKTSTHYGKIDVLHNNAATKTSDVRKFFNSVEDYELETWREVMSVNVDAMFFLAREVGKLMKDQAQGGSIINTASIYGVVGPDQRIYKDSDYLGGKINTPPVYSVSKSAVLGLTKYLATYWGKDNIRVNSITPGGIESGQNQEFKDLYNEKVPLGRMGEPNEISSALVFLCSDESRYITGQNIIVDGGFSVW